MTLVQQTFEKRTIEQRLFVQVVKRTHVKWDSCRTGQKKNRLKGLRMVARALWRSEARRVVPWSETLHEP